MTAKQWQWTTDDLSIGRRPRRSRRVGIGLIAIAAAIIAGCSGDESTDPGMQVADPFPVPTEEVVLTAVGAVGQANAGDEVQADIAGIESLGTVTRTVFEPFVREELEFTGVPIDKVLAAIGIEPDAKLTWTALDDYQVSFTRAELADEDALLATRLNGELIPIVDGGPIRVVFVDDSGTIGRDSNQWIWSLVHIEVG